MADQENSVRVTRGMKRRAVATDDVNQQQQQPSLKRRVVLGVISNSLSNRAVESKHVVKEVLETPKCNKKVKVKKAVNVSKDVKILKDVHPSIDVDGDLEDPQMCKAYVSEIYDYLHKMETEPKRRPLPDYIQTVQKDVTANMRGVLVDWLVEVAEEYKLVSDTLFLTISYVDRYLSSNVINRHKLQLLGISAMLIASKYEEITPQNVDDFCYITDNTYTKQEVVAMEAAILKTLNFELGNPTVKTFLRSFTRIVEENYKTLNLTFEFIGYYLTELSILDYSLVKYLPSLVAASVIYLSRFTINPTTNPWTPLLQQKTGYSASDLKDCVKILQDLQMQKRGKTLIAVRDKYKQHKFKCVSELSSHNIPDSYFEDV